jgi:hypothetical protein
MHPGMHEFATTSQGIDLRFANQHTLVNVYQKSDVANVK